MPIHRIVLAAVVVALATRAHAATYYVDQTAGNDASSGSSPATAWKNSPGMSAYSGSGVLRPGDVVYFDRADTWLVSGTQGLYLTGGVTYIGDGWGSGTRRAVLRASTDLAAGVVRFRDDPSAATVFKGFEVDANGKVTSGVDMNHAFYASPLTGATKRVQDCEVHNVMSRQAQGQYKYGVIVSNHGGTAAAVENVEILNTVVHDVSRDAICLYPGDENASCRIRNITVRGSEAYNTGQDPDYCCGAGILVKGYVQDAFVEYNYVHDVKGASIFLNSNETNHFAGVGMSNIHLRHNIVTNSTSNGAIRLYDGSSGGDPKDVKIYGNIVYNSTSNGGLMLGTDLQNTLNLLVDNNTFYNAPVIVLRSTATFASFEFKNNLVVYSSGVPVTDDGMYITAHSNNLYFRGGGTLVSAGGASYTSTNLANYEPSGVSSNPLLNNPANLPTGFTGTFGTNLAPNSDGLGLQPGSPAIDHGAALASTYATSINSVRRPSGSGWDIGAYEAGANSPPAPTNLRFVR